MNLAVTSAHAERATPRPAPVIVNLGCGTKTSDRCINVDFSMYALLRRNAWLLPFATPLIGHERSARIRAMRGPVIHHNLASGIPFADGYADAVYHSHVMEHIPREAVVGFQKEILRVLKPGGIQRICLPDLEHLVREYDRSLAADDLTYAAAQRHDDAIAQMFEQCVRDRPAGTRRKTGFAPWLQNLVLGDARARGEIHLWMWDRVNIRAVLRQAGFTDINVRRWNSSAIDGWADTGLETDGDGREYKPHSLYIECRRPL
ncbi:class I SAM-dependent methyltransferase [Rhodopseudomonas sp. NSM]|uniref:class I SAM-dependent methyltransferase n=1 Tax=Rhodopseudomonas sp. NSM TaxID=3457630 RepID=UPI004035C42E